MTTWAVLASGPSMNQQVADTVRGRCHVMAVSDSYRLAPWADAMASTDAAWWAQHPLARVFEGRKFTGAPRFQGLDDIERIPDGLPGTNSGLLGCMAARHMGATALLLCGFDMRGTHFFGEHPAGLVNTPPARFDLMRTQFTRWWPKGLAIVNCTPGSGLTSYPALDLATALERYAS